MQLRNVFGFHMRAAIDAGRVSADSDVIDVEGAPDDD